MHAQTQEQTLEQGQISFGLNGITEICKPLLDIGEWERGVSEYRLIKNNKRINFISGKSKWFDIFLFYFLFYLFDFFLLGGGRYFYYDRKLVGILGVMKTKKYGGKGRGTPQDNEFRDFGFVCSFF